MFSIFRSVGLKFLCAFQVFCLVFSGVLMFSICFAVFSWIGTVSQVFCRVSWDV